ncbi:hypothetical protein MTP06_19000 [Streptomyces sp. PLM4]|nr:hypothetical protein MTP06_19000 [Streptomyces sp. PLM4]
MSASEKPCVTALRRPACAATTSLWRAARATSTATPTAPPTCCTELRTAEPSPAFSSVVPVSAATVSAGSPSPQPRLVTSMPGSTPRTYASSAATPDSSSSPAALIRNDRTRAGRTPSLVTARAESHMPVRMPAP